MLVLVLVLVLVLLLVLVVGEDKGRPRRHCCSSMWCWRNCCCCGPKVVLEEVLLPLRDGGLAKELCEPAEVTRQKRGAENGAGGDAPEYQERTEAVGEAGSAASSKTAPTVGW